MTGQLSAAEPYTIRWEAQVLAVDGRDVILDTSYFYTESGGQPSDQGRIGNLDVVEVRREGGDVVHTLSDPPSFDTGTSVLSAIDRTRRLYHMRAHTASHALYGAGRRLLDDLGYGGFDIATPALDTDHVMATPENGKVRIDFRTSTDVDDATLVEMERLVNRAVWDGREVAWTSIPLSEARERDEIAFNTKTEEGVFDDADSVRVVTIQGLKGEDQHWDVAACGGTHVRNTAEIGPVSVFDRSNPGEGLTRIEFTVGPPGISRRMAEKRASLDASSTLGVPVADVPDSIDRLLTERDDLQATIEDLQAQLVGAQLDGVGEDVIERDGSTWAIDVVDGVGPNDVREPVENAVGRVADVVALAGQDGSTFVVAGSLGDPPADDVIDEVANAFGGGGGGSKTFAQGGGFDASPADIVGYLREE
jgi:alanyl-tRNA synthetase